MFKNLFKPDIAKLEEQKNINKLEEAARSKNRSISIAALQALIRLNSLHEVNLIFQSLEGKDKKPPYDKETARELINAIGASVTHFEINYYLKYKGKGHSDTKWRFGERIQAIGAPAIDPLITACKELFTNNGSLSAAADLVEELNDLNLYTKLPDPRIADFLLDLLDDTYPIKAWYRYQDLQREAIRGVGITKDKRAVELLIAILANNAIDSLVREKAAVVLGTLQDQRAVETLLNALNDETPYIRETAGKALSELGITDTTAIAGQSIAEINSGDKKVKIKAIKTLGWLKVISSFDLLVAQSSDKDDDICAAAVASLKAIDVQRAQKIFKKRCEVGHRFSVEKAGKTYFELVQECILCGYQKTRLQQCERCGSTNLVLQKDPYEETRVFCNSCGKYAPD